MKRILIIPDIKGWAVDNMADNIIRILSSEFSFDKVFAEDWEPGEFKKFILKSKDQYDLIYLMLPSYVSEEFGTDKIITTFHGGPGTEGQADTLDRNRQNDLPISYVSTQVWDRVINFEHKTNRKFKAPVCAVIDEKRMYKEQNLDAESIVKKRIDLPNGPLKNPNYKVLINLHLWRKGFGLRNVNYFTPHGINPNEYKYHPTKIKTFTCGYAGWGKYLLGGQADHRRAEWIFEAQGQMKFDLKCATGLKEHAFYDTNILRNRYWQPQYDFQCLEKHRMGGFYSGLDCYLVPDKYAGGPMPVLEAGILGVPPVCSRAGVCGDIIEHMKTGYVYKDDSFKDFFEGIRFMRDNPEKRIEMGQNLKEIILKTRTWESVKHSWREFFNLGG